MEVSNIGKDRKQRVKPTDLSSLVYGKVPPQARDMEEAVLGAVLLGIRGAIDEVTDIIGAECFYVDAHQRIFSACLQLRAQYMPIDTLTAMEQLRKNDELDIIGGPYYLTKLTKDVQSSANIVTHCQVIYQKFIQRELIRISGEVIGQAYEDSTDAFDLMDSASIQINTLSIRNSGKEYTDLHDNAVEVLADVVRVKESGNHLTGTPSGIVQLDDITQGFQPTELIVIAARPSVGKSAVAANIARGAAFHPVKPTNVGVFSLEMSSKKWTQRIMSADSEIAANELKRGMVTDNDISRLGSLISNQYVRDKIKFDDTAGLKISQLKRKARKMVTQDKVGMIIVDYLQLATADITKGNREQEISSISRALKGLAKELEVPVIALSQLSRQGDNSEPRLSHLRESGAIEQDADIVIFLIPVDESGESQDPELRDSIMLKIAKYRDGALEPVPIRFVKRIQKIFSSESDYQRYIGGNSGSWKPINVPTGTPAANHYESKRSIQQQFDEGFDQDELV